MLKRKMILYSLAVAAVGLHILGIDDVNSAWVDPCKFSVTANAGVVMVCPRGDGDPLTSPVGGGNCQITLTVKDITNTGIPGIPAVDMWLVGCNDGLLLCGGSSGSSADAATNSSGVTTFSHEPISGGCDTGLFVVVTGMVAQIPGSCFPNCVPIATRSPDYKSSAGCGAIDNRCPDSRVTSADFSWFITHYPTGANPGAPYLPCADFAASLGVITLADFTRFVQHFAGAGHNCPI